jgi:hypothetical protein
MKIPARIVCGASTLFFMSVGYQAPAMAQNATAGAATNLPTTNLSVTITTGSTFQTVLQAISSPPTTVTRRSMTIQNNNTSDSCWLTFGKIGSTNITSGNAAKASSILLLAGGSLTRYWPYVPSDEIEGTCASNSDTLYIDTQ